MVHPQYNTTVAGLHERTHLNLSEEEITVAGTGIFNDNKERDG